eukprot:14267998-Ditylum_brightwellii.AAC.1
MSHPHSFPVRGMSNVLLQVGIPFQAWVRAPSSIIGDPLKTFGTSKVKWIGSLSNHFNMGIVDKNNPIPLKRALVWCDRCNQYRELVAGGFRSALGIPSA